ncbi:MAG TPA: HAD-IIA family hydrolase [Solirubrobacteraceae bacterium]|jgi:NagD protein|nr:HAD-IIA family hydrolase [Solirubrobacteraceae bacterium]
MADSRAPQQGCRQAGRQPQDIPRFDAYIFDLDGTLYLDEQPIPGAPETVARLRAEGARVAFVTNNPLAAPAAYARRLTEIGIPASADEVTTSVEALVDYLDATRPGCRVLAVAEHVVIERLGAAGYGVTKDPAGADVVVVSFDRGFDYAKLHAAYRAVREHGAAIVATNPDPYCPTADGGLPDCAAMLAAIEACTGVAAEAIVGKPSRQMVRTVLRRVDVDPSRAAVVGDRLMTDVAMGQAAGAAGVLVLSGATSAADLEGDPVTPDYVIESVRDLLGPDVLG